MSVPVSFLVLPQVKKTGQSWPSARGQRLGLRTDVVALGKEPTSLLLSIKVASQDNRWPLSWGLPDLGSCLLEVGTW